MTQYGAALGTMRPPFLILTPACVLVGAGTALHSGAAFNLHLFVLSIVAALAAHISVNTFNEYYDFRSGLDLNTLRTPFSGGSGTLPANPEIARTTLLLAVVTLGLTIAIGSYLVYLRGWLLLPLGVTGTVIILSYTSYITRHPILCLIAPGVGFGPLMVAGTHYVLTGVLSWPALSASLIPFFLVNNLLLANQFPDLEPDRESGRYHFPIAYGRRASAIVYGLFALLAYLAITGAVLLGHLPPYSLLGLLTLPFAVHVTRVLYRNTIVVAELLPALGMNVVVAVLTPFLIATGCLI